jgi:hypothetical protein
MRKVRKITLWQLACVYLNVCDLIGYANGVMKWIELPPDAAMVKQPTLLITTDNIISAMADFPTQMKGMVRDLRVEKLEGGHWIMLERREEMNRILGEFVEG